MPPIGSSRSSRPSNQTLRQPSSAKTLPSSRTWTKSAMRSKQRKTILNLLFMSQGTMSLKGRDGKSPHPVPLNSASTSPIDKFPRRDFRRPRQKANNKLPLPHPLRPATPPTPPIRLPPTRPRSLRPSPRRRNAPRSLQTWTGKQASRFEWPPVTPSQRRASPLKKWRR